MLTELRKKSQITIPKDVVKRMGLKEGDQFEIVEQGGVIHLVPVAIYPKRYVEELKEEMETLKSDIQSGKKAVFDNVDDLFAQLDKDER
ncbi:AbrB/MazE/SpoVT family DNA-binding domain-containing protein [Anoxynatronum sibiricum]|uniref:AbrB/MazE/SpoVT family DNA-binding domain-containing protein n=1 Tax=Anoxynatronum sibiricum TaxID=210623 RepID=A0ABU9VTQ9_9CLOT